MHHGDVDEKRFWCRKGLYWTPISQCVAMDDGPCACLQLHTHGGWLDTAMFDEKLNRFASPFCYVAL